MFKDVKGYAKLNKANVVAQQIRDRAIAQEMKVVVKVIRRSWSDGRFVPVVFFDNETNPGSGQFVINLAWDKFNCYGTSLDWFVVEIMDLNLTPFEIAFFRDDLDVNNWK